VNDGQANIARAASMGVPPVLAEGRRQAKSDRKNEKSSANTAHVSPFEYSSINSLPAGIKQTFARPIPFQYNVLVTTFEKLTND
jgi:hypothetical protein